MTNEQVNVLKQRTRKQFVKIDLLNREDNVINEIIGVVLSGNISISNNSAYRRSGSISILAKNNQFIPSPTSYVWFDKRVKIQMGIENYQGKIVWFDLGKFAYTDCNIVENIDEHIINLELADYMSFLDGTLGGGITSKVKMVEKGIKINQAIQAILTGLCKFSIEKPVLNGKDLELPYRIEKNAGITVFELIKEISDLYMGYEFFFDENGYFIFQKIRDGKQDEYVWDFTEIDYTINKSTNINFSKVKNDIWIYGYTDKYGVQVIYGCQNRYVRPYITRVQEITGQNKNDICYITSLKKSYIWNGTEWTLLDFNVFPEFCSESIGVLSTVINDNKVYNEEQAKLSAEYYLFTQGRFAKTVSFSCVPIFGLSVNQKIKLKDDDYIINSIDIPLSYDGVMNITASKILY